MRLAVSSLEAQISRKYPGIPAPFNSGIFSLSFFSNVYIFIPSRLCFNICSLSNLGWDSPYHKCFLLQIPIAVSGPAVWHPAQDNFDFSYFPHTSRNLLDGSLRTISTHNAVGLSLTLQIFSSCYLLPYWIPNLTHGKRPNPLPNPFKNLVNYTPSSESHVFVQQILVYSTSICACYGPGTARRWMEQTCTHDTCLKPHVDSCRASATYNLEIAFLEAQSFRQKLQGHLWLSSLTHHRNPSLFKVPHLSPLKCGLIL